MEHWELIIIGAGPAGITAGIYGARSDLRTLILEANHTGGLVATASWIENYPGFPDGITGTDLITNMSSQCKKFGAKIRESEGVSELDLSKDRKIVKTGKSEYEAEAVIIASGSRHKTLGVPGEEAFQGKGVSYCAVCDGFFFKGKRVLVVGGGNTAAMSALYLGNLNSIVYLAHRRDQLRAEEAYVKEMRKNGVRFLWNTEVKEIQGNSIVKNVVLFNNKTKKTEKMNLDGIFILVGEIPNSEFAIKAGVRADEKGFILANELQRTNIQGVYAVGDVTSCPVKQIGTAVGQAIIATTEAFTYIKHPYYMNSRIVKSSRS